METTDRGRLRLLLLTIFSASLVGTAGCGWVGASPELKLGVPYYRQPAGSMYCGPASIAMWRAYDGLSPLSQDAIAAGIGASWYSGASAEAIAYGVSRYTLTRDAYVDLDSRAGERGFMSRQITSIDGGLPVIALVESGFHTGVVNGGTWRQSGPDYHWEYVYFHDPSPTLGGENRRYSSGSWLDFSAGDGGTLWQVVSFAAVLQWQANLSTYGDRVRVNGDPCLDYPERPICP